MGRQVILKDTGNKVDIKDAFKGQLEVHHKDGSITQKNVYYSSEEAFNKDVNDKVYWTKCMDKLMEILGYEPGMKLPTVAAKKFSEIRGFGMDVVYSTICHCESDGVFDYASTLEYKNEYNKVSYYSSIIVNRVADEYKNKKHCERLLNTNHINPMEDDVIYVGNNNKKDISRFLEDE